MQPYKRHVVLFESRPHHAWPARLEVRCLFAWFRDNFVHIYIYIRIVLQLEPDTALFNSTSVRGAFLVLVLEKTTNLS